MNIIPGNNIIHASGHGGAYGEDEALFKRPTQHA